MAFPFTTPNDYVGFVSISQNTYTESDIEKYIERIEPIIVRDLLNAHAYEDLKVSPLPQKYIDLMNGVSYFNEDGDRCYNSGLKEILKLWIFYHYGSDNWFSTPAGRTQNDNENASRINDGRNKQILYGRYNDGIRIYRHELIPFIMEHELMEQEITNFIIDAPGSFTILTPNTQYLSNGDEIIYDGNRYEISLLIPDTSFSIVAPIGSSFYGTYKYEPFKDFNKPNKKTVWL
jgi:hypothetical protein